MPPHLWARTAQVSETLCAVLNTILYNEKRKKHRSAKQNCTLEPCINKISEFLLMWWFLISVHPAIADLCQFVTCDLPLENIWTSRSRLASFGCKTAWMLLFTDLCPGVGRCGYQCCMPNTVSLLPVETPSFNQPDNHTYLTKRKNSLVLHNLFRTMKMYYFIRVLSLEMLTKLE